MIIEKEKNTAFYTYEEKFVNETTGEIISSTQKTITKVSPEPDFIKVYYQTMLAFNQIHDIPVSFVLSLSKFISWTNDGKPITIALNKLNKEIMCEDCGISMPQINRYIKRAVEKGLLFRLPEYRGIFEVNPFFIAKGKWESIRKLRTTFEFIDGKWERIIETKEVNEYADEE